MIFQQIPLGLLRANTYLLADTESREGVVIDVGGDSKLLLEKIRKEDIQIQKILLTHGHLDHILGANETKFALGATMYLHYEDRELFRDSKLRNFFGPSAVDHLDVDVFLEDGQVIIFGKHHLKVIHTPGHTQGSVCFLLDDQILFSGDTLFYQNIGRTDHRGGDTEQEIRSIKKYLLDLSENIKVYPGHGRSTDIGHERKHNPFLQ